jgi:hypothetical protein
MIWVNKLFYIFFQPVCEVEKNLSDVLTLKVRFIKVVGNQPSAISKLSENVNGILFILKGCPRTLSSEVSRLSDIVMQNSKGLFCSLAVLVVGVENLSVEELVTQLKIDSLMERKLISQFQVFTHCENSQDLPHIQVYILFCLPFYLYNLVRLKYLSCDEF